MPEDSRAQQKFIEEQVKLAQSKYYSEKQRNAAIYLQSWIKDMTDPFLRLEVCKINEVIKRKYQQPSTSLIMQGAAESMDRAIRRVATQIGAGPQLDKDTTANGILPRVGSTVSIGATTSMICGQQKPINSRRKNASNQFFQDFKIRGGGANVSAVRNN